MMRLLLFAGLALLCSTPALAKLPPDAEKAAQQFLKAYVRNDRAELKKLSPSKLENFYGPFLFKQLPTLQGPKVDAHRAVIEFTGKSLDPELPDHGTLVLAKLDERKEDPWVVSQMFWFDRDHLPLGVKAPKSSASPADKRQEPAVVRAARKYLEAWKSRDYSEMQHLSYDWMAHKSKSGSIAKLSRLKLTEAGELEGAIKVKYDAQLLLLRFLPHRTSGFVYVMQEDGAWKVRGNNVSF